MKSRCGAALATRALLGCIGIVLFLGAQTATAKKRRLSVDREAVSHLKLLTLDRALPRRHGGRIAFGVVYKNLDATAKKRASAMVSAFKRAGRSMLINDQKIKAYLISEAELESKIESKTLTFLYLTEGTDTSWIVAIANRKGLPTCTADLSAIESKGVTFGVYARGGQPRIAINLTNAKKMGVVFHAGLVRIATVFK